MNEWRESGATVQRSIIDPAVWVAIVGNGAYFEYVGEDQDLVAGGIRAVKRWCEERIDTAGWQTHWEKNVLMVRPRGQQ